MNRYGSVLFFCMTSIICSEYSPKRERDEDQHESYYVSSGLCQNDKSLGRYIATGSMCNTVQVIGEGGLKKWIGVCDFVGRNVGITDKVARCLGQGLKEYGFPDLEKDNDLSSVKIRVQEVFEKVHGHVFLANSSLSDSGCSVGLVYIDEKNQRALACVLGDVKIAFIPHLSQPSYEFRSQTTHHRSECSRLKQLSGNNECIDSGKRLFGKTDMTRFLGMTALASKFALPELPCIPYRLDQKSGYSEREVFRSPLWQTFNLKKRTFGTFVVATYNLFKDLNKSKVIGKELEIVDAQFALSALLSKANGCTGTLLIARAIKSTDV